MNRVLFGPFTLAICVAGLTAGGCAGRPPEVDPSPKGALDSQIETLQERAHESVATGRHARARESLEQARRIAASIDDQTALVDLSRELGDLELQEGRLLDATALHRQALHMAEQSGDGRRIMLSLGSLAATEQQAGRVESSAKLYERAMDLARERGDRGTLAVLLNNIGLLHQGRGDVDAARQAYQEASTINKELGQREAEASNHANLGMLAEDRREFEQAAREFALALDLDKEVENRRGIAADLANMGRIAVRLGRTEQGLDYLDRAYRSYAAQGDRMRALEALSNAVEAARQSGRLDDAKRLEAESASLKSLPASR
jgi:tetratricopeptide (TPR) repeat protein